MKEEIIISHSKLMAQPKNRDFSLLDHPLLWPNFKAEIAFGIATGSKTSKFDLSKLNDVEKLSWLLIANDIIDFDLTYPIIEEIHNTDYLQPSIEAAKIFNELSISIADLESSLPINFSDYNYEYYLHFNTATNPLKLPTLTKTEDYIENIIKYNYTVYDCFFSVTFINSIIARYKGKDINLSFVIFKARKNKMTVGIIAESTLRGDTSYYDISHTPPPDGDGSLLSIVLPHLYK